jgi:MOSC domain-containing protein YiiM
MYRRLPTFVKMPGSNHLGPAQDKSCTVRLRNVLLPNGATMKSQQRLQDRYLQHLRPGSVSWIGLRPGHRQAMQEVDSAVALQDLGLEGDHRCAKTAGSSRQLTIISTEYIQQIEYFCNRHTITPDLLRRNLVVSGINLGALRHQRLAVGAAILETTALCHPCSRMEAALGPGGFAAMLGHGGLCAKILQGGRIAVGDTVRRLAPQGELF